MDIFNLFNIVDEEAEKKAALEKAEKEAKEQAEREEKEAQLKAIEEEKQKRLAEEQAKQEALTQRLEELKAIPEEEISVDEREEMVELEKQLSSTKSNSYTSSKKTFSPKDKNNKEEPFKPTEETVIRYLGESIPITQYFTVEELAEGLLVTGKDKEQERKELTGEMLRKRMEKDYPELVSNYTEMVFLKKSNGTFVVPMTKAKKKGANTLLEAVSKDTASARIPFFILDRFIGIAKHMAEYSLEIHADIYMDEDGEFFLDVPPQVVHRYWCEVTESSYDTFERLGLATKVVEIHSHHEMKPNPSEQDNASERQPRMIYVIVGEVNNFFPNITLRTFNGTDWDSLEIGDVFESAKYPPFPYSLIESEHIRVAQDGDDL